MKNVFEFLGTQLGRCIMFTVIAVFNLALGVAYHSTLLMLTGAIWCWSSGACFAGHFHEKILAIYKRMIDRQADVLYNKSKAAK